MDCIHGSVAINLIWLDKQWSFGKHFLLQKLFGNPKHQSNKSILEYNMQCLDDPSDELVQSIEYGRCAIGTKLPDGSIKEMDSSGDIGLFSRGLLVKLQTQYHDRLTVVPGEDASLLQVNRGVLHGVTTVDQHVSRSSMCIMFSFPMFFILSYGYRILCDQRAMTLCEKLTRLL